MRTMLSGRRSFRNCRSHHVLTAGMGLLLALLLSGTAWGQQIRVSGTVTAADVGPLGGVMVRVEGTDTSTFTNAGGRYSITAPANGALSFVLLGRRPVRTPIDGRTTIDVMMQRIAYLEEVVVTGYTEQRRADITGAVAGVNVESADRQTSASMLQRLDATVSGVTVAASGSPGSRSTVRIRGLGSFQNNDPLYIVDGTPVQESYINWLNPSDIESIQVLKDASAASIYGSRASNGVVVIETTKAGVMGRPRATLSVRTGITTPVRGYDDFLMSDALEYFEVVRQSHVNAGLPVPTNIYGDPNNPTLPKYIWPNNCGPDGAPGPCSSIDESSYSFPNSLIMPASAGTNWWDAVFGQGFIGDYNLAISGAGENNAYGVSFNYFDQQGTAAYNSFKRGSVRVNTSFRPGRFTFGENLAIAVERSYGGLPDDNTGEDNIIGKNILMQPVVPVYDIAGNFASGKAVGLGNQTNPLKYAFAHKDDHNRNDRVFGNAFVGFDVNSDLALQSKFGFNLGRSSFTGFAPILPENSEPTFTNSINENSNQFTDWTWSNTLTYRRQLLENHNLGLLLGQEANRNTHRFIGAGMSNLLNTDVNSRYLQDALGDAATKNVFSSGGRSALLSFFGKADYNFADRYVLSFTLRRDGSSNLGPSFRWGTFPAFGVGWRLSNEPFMPESRLFSDVMLRFGWGVTGNQLIPSGRIVSQFGGGRGDTFYDIGGTNTRIEPGFRQTSLGNRGLKWEENRSANIGADIALLEGTVDVVIDLYQRHTNNLLFDPPTPGTAGVAAPPIVNVGKMRNRGFDLSIGHRGVTWTAILNGSHYRNKIVRIDGVQDFFYGPISTRFGNQVINQVGHPIGSFYGLVAEGFFRDADDVANHAQQDGAAPGRIKFRDVNGDGQVTLADRTIIGSPHPDFTAGLDLGARWRSWDVGATLFGTFGNDIFDAQKEYYVFRNFSTNVRDDMLTNSWTPEKPNAKYPRLDVNDNFSRVISSYYVEDGSYVRLRNLQIGYNIPPTFARWLTASRVYLQGENLFTITGYSGLDPALPAASAFGPAGDIRDQYRGVDRGSYPSNRMFSVGIVANF
ncbi:MAG: SusC/RagA family TonB-linked outer membrane protein [Gemmatimonadota bacterium]|nr:SusC/RagA family TonB-linked outer membrane protein [Gemmatimonadota bacterium]